MSKNKTEHFPTTEKLHSDVLEEKYGPIHSEVMEHNDQIREALLVDEKGIARTYALTFFPEKKENGDIAIIDDKIKNGGMIGKTFREFNYEIRKNVIDVFIVEIPKWLKNKFSDEKNHAKARISEFYAKKEVAEPVIYGYVLEIYAPDFKEPIINSKDFAQINPSTEQFGKINISKEEIWKRLEKASEVDEWDDIKDDFKIAKMNTRELAYDLKRKMEDKLNLEK